jgi:ABC-2 type transport system permease protein
MRKVFLIATRDYREVVFTRTFLLGLLLAPVLLLGTSAVLAVVMVLADFSNREEKRYAVVDRTPGGKLYAPLETAVQSRNERLKYTLASEFAERFSLERVEPSADTVEAIARQRLELSERVRRGELFGFIEIGPDVGRGYRAADGKAGLGSPLRPHRPGPAVGLNGLAPPLDTPPEDEAERERWERAAVRFQGKTQVLDLFAIWADPVINQAILRQRLLDAGLPAEQVPSLAPVPFLNRPLSAVNADSGEIKEPPTAAQALPMLLAGIMFLQVMIVSGLALKHIREEKKQRIIEMFLGSVRPFELMMGKLLGLTGIALTVSVVYLGAACASGALAGLPDLLPVSVLVWFLIYQVLAQMMFGSLSLAIGTLIGDNDAGELLHMPVGLLSALPLLLLMPVLSNPDGTFSTAISFFPFATPVLMTARLAMPPGPPWWQPILGIVPVAATIVFCVFVAGRIFRVGVLLQGTQPKLRDLLRWAIQG